MVAQIQGLVFACLLILVYARDPYRINKDYPAYVQLAFLSIALVMFGTYFYTIHISSEGTGSLMQMYSKMLISFAFIMVLIAAVFGVGWALQRYPSIIPFIFSLLKIGMLAGALYIMVRVLPKTLPIPATGATDQFAKMVLLIEFIIVFVYLAAPYALRFAMNQNGRELIREPIGLDREKSFEIKKVADPNYRFAISGWFYINPQPINTRIAFTKFTNILSRDDNPLVEYKSSTQTLKISTFNIDQVKEIIYETNDIPLQTWNHLVVNYDGGTLDVFLNGHLVVSKSNTIPYETESTIMVRAGEMDGIEGGICNVVCYHEPLSSESIEFQYKLLKEYHRPVM
jgi:hypothetical protein